MKNTFRFITLLCIVGSVLLVLNSSQAQPQNMRTKVATPVQGECFQGYIFDKHYTLLPFEDTNSKFTPTYDDVVKAERIVREQLILTGKINDQSVHKNYIRDHLCEYQRQYRGYLTPEGDSIISINYLLGDYDALGIDSEILMVNDGGETVWNADVNLSKNTIERFNVNGVG